MIVPQRKTSISQEPVGLKLWDEKFCIQKLEQFSMGWNERVHFTFIPLTYNSVYRMRMEEILFGWPIQGNYVILCWYILQRYWWALCETAQLNEQMLIFPSTVFHPNFLNQSQSFKQENHSRRLEKLEQIKQKLQSTFRPGFTGQALPASKELLYSPNRHEARGVVSE